MIPLIDNIIKLITYGNTFNDIKALCVTCKDISHLIKNNITFKSDKKIRYWIDSNNLKLINFMYNKINRLQIESEFNTFPSPVKMSPKCNLLINKFTNLSHLQYLDLYRCKWISLKELEIAIISYLPNLQKLDFSDSLAETELFSGKTYLNCNGLVMKDDELAKYNTCLENLNTNAKINIELIRSNSIITIHKFMNILLKNTKELYTYCFIGKFLNPYNIQIKNKSINNRLHSDFIYGIIDLMYIIGSHLYINDINLSTKFEILIYSEFISNMYISNKLIELLIKLQLYESVYLCINDGYNFTPDNFNLLLERKPDMLINNRIYFIKLLFEKNIQFYKHSVLLKLYEYNYSFEILEIFHKRGAYITIPFIETIISSGDEKIYKWCESIGFELAIYSNSDIENNLIYKLVTYPKKKKQNNNITYIFNKLVNKGINQYHKQICENIMKSTINLDYKNIWDLILWHIFNINKDIRIHENHFNKMPSSDVERLLNKECDINIIVNTTKRVVSQQPIDNINYILEYNSNVIYTIPILEWFLNEKNTKFVFKLFHNYNKTLTTLEYLKYANNSISIFNLIDSDMSYLNIKNKELWFTFLNTIEKCNDSYDILKYLIVKLNNFLDSTIVEKIIDEIERLRWCCCLHLVVDHLYPKFKKQIEDYSKEKNYKIVSIIGE